MSPPTVNTIGLAFDVIGFTLIYFFGFPKAPGMILLNWGTAPKGVYRHSDLLATLGLWLAITGFLLQIASNHLPPGTQ